MTDKALDNSSRRIITIGRQFGAGGRSVGKLVANKLGIDFYDKELIAEAAKVSELSDKFITHMDEQHTSSLLYSLILHAQTPGIFGKGKPIELLAYDAQIASVKAVASKGPCVIVGRAADCILWDEYDVMSFFLTARCQTAFATSPKEIHFLRTRQLKKSHGLTKHANPFITAFPTANGQRRRLMTCA